MTNVRPVLPVVGVEIPRSGVLSFHYQRSPTHKHQGVDLHAPAGTPVFASLPGTVEHVAHALKSGFSGYGRVVVIRSAPEETPGGQTPLWCLYAHLDQPQVTEGQHVKLGQRIATVGDTCFSRKTPQRRCNRAHLHFEISPARYPQASEAPRLDPRAFLGASPSEPTRTPAPMPAPTPAPAVAQTPRHVSTVRYTPPSQVPARPPAPPIPARVGAVACVLAALLKLLWDQFR